MPLKSSNKASHLRGNLQSAKLQISTIWHDLVPPDKSGNICLNFTIKSQMLLIGEKPCAETEETEGNQEDKYSLSPPEPGKDYPLSQDY
jgi:hypothetical protein